MCWHVPRVAWEHYQSLCLVSNSGSRVVFGMVGGKCIFAILLYSLIDIINNHLPDIISLWL